MASVNRVLILGNLTRDPELRYASSGTAVCTLSVATNRTWKNKTSGEKEEEVEFHRVVLYDRLAEIAGEYTAKGKPVFIEGRLKTRKWEDKEGVTRYTTEVVAESMQLLGGRDDGERPQRGSADNRPRSGSGANKPAPKSNTGFDDLDSDIPFVTCSMQRDMSTLRDRKLRRYGGDL
jgi:single-strand DNA-binding protein